MACLGVNPQGFDNRSDDQETEEKDGGHKGTGALDSRRNCSLQNRIQHD